MRKKISLALVVVLAVVAAAGLGYLWKSERDASARRQALTLAYERDIRVLFDERAGLEAQVAELDAHPPEEDVMLGSLIILFMEPDARIMAGPAEEMAERGMVGMIAVSAEMFPGDEGCLTVAEAQSLIARHWEIVLSLEEPGEAAALTARLRESGLPQPMMACIPEETDADWEAELSGLNLIALIQRGEQPEESEGLWRVEAKGSYETGSATKLAEVAGKSLCVAFTVGYRNSYEMYAATNFGNMLTTAAGYAEAGQLLVATARESQARWEARQRIVAEKRAEQQAQRDELNALLADVAQRINARNLEYSDQTLGK